MAEIEIKRTNFFDGQFLKQDEFLDLDAYHLHMRRRWAFVLFNQSGVIQASDADLRIEVSDPGPKTLLVRAGMAIGMQPGLAEAREIVLREDALIDPTRVSANVPAALLNGNTGFVTVHYVEEPVAQPPSEGDVSGNTRIKEHARITVHNVVPEPTAPNGEPYVRLGDVTITDTGVTRSYERRQTAFLNTALLGQPPLPAQISVSPLTVPSAGSVSMTIRAVRGIDLSGATAASITISPNPGIGSLVVSQQTQTSLLLDLVLASPPPGIYTLTVTTNASASTSFEVVAAGTPQISVTSSQGPGLGSVILTINATGNIDLSGAADASVTISPNQGISDLSVSNPTKKSVLVGFTLTEATQPGVRTITITTDASASTIFLIEASQIPKISVTPNSLPAPVNETAEALLIITASGGIDLRGLKTAGVTLSASGAFGVKLAVSSVTILSQTSMTVGIVYGSRGFIRVPCTVTVRANAIVSANFAIEAENI
ncbi:MAG: hypothetical protein ABJA98_06515 [Acidobacteriota bacterium]